jgi:hypothetical protein
VFVSAFSHWTCCCLLHVGFLANSFFEPDDDGDMFLRNGRSLPTNTRRYFIIIEVTGEWRKLHNEELHDLYSSQSIIRIIKSRRMRWAGHVARMGRRGTRIGC